MIRIGKLVGTENKVPVIRSWAVGENMVSIV